VALGFLSSPDVYGQEGWPTSIQHGTDALNLRGRVVTASGGADKSVAYHHDVPEDIYIKTVIKVRSGYAY